MDKLSFPVCEGFSHMGVSHMGYEGFHTWGTGVLTHRHERDRKVVCTACQLLFVFPSLVSMFGDWELCMLWGFVGSKPGCTHTHTHILLNHLREGSSRMGETRQQSPARKRTHQWEP